MKPPELARNSPSGAAGSDHNGFLSATTSSQKKPRRKAFDPSLGSASNGHTPDLKNTRDTYVNIICVYPTIHAGKLARQWIETALSSGDSEMKSMIEYFSYEILSHGGISWGHVMERFCPQIVLILSDGKHQLVSELRNSFRQLLAPSHNGPGILVIFRNLEPRPTLNTRIMLDYVSALTQRNHCEFKTVDGNGDSIKCFRHPNLLLQGRRYHE
jgi:hypothetical protein